MQNGCREKQKRFCTLHDLSVISPTEPEVTRAHTNLFLTRGWGIEELRHAQILDGNLALFLPCELSTEQRSTVYT